MHSNVTSGATELIELRLEWEEIARSEVTRHRRKLGQLTPEQQTEVESALVSVTGEIFQRILEGAESYSGLDRLKYMNAWRREAA